MAISTDYKRTFVLVSKKEYKYLDTIKSIYNEQLEHDKRRLIKNIKFMSVSCLYQIAIKLLILDIDRHIDTTLSKEENHKRIYNFLSGKDFRRKK